MSDPSSQFARLLVQHDRTLLRYILTFIPRRDDAEEVLQRTAVVLWEKFSEFDREREFLPWAVKFAYFEVLNYRKEYARNRLVFSQEAIDSLAQSIEEQNAYLDAQRIALRDCLEKLKEEELALLQRRYLDSSSIAAMAAGMGKTAKSLYRRMDRIREAIVTCVERRLVRNMS